ncbi:AraC family transcriptional regulator [Alloscardovia macacae]|uniref:AraC family transcriptional regulator n=2 Tax=Alloscardovia macacae TaxID=1160091 RepID=A0A261F057_9BIFI|nr:AraC family transcriptional regulator [Alloscardovia macacae]
MISVNYSTQAARISSLPLRVQLLGVAHQQEHVVRPSGLHVFQCFACRRGSGVFVVDGEEHNIREGEGFLIYPRVSHEYYATSGDWELDFFAFDGALAYGLLECLDMPESHAYHFFDQTYFRQSVEHMVRMHREKGEYAYALSAACYDLLVHLPHMIEPLTAVALSSENVLISSIIAYVEERYADYINLDDIARHCSYSKEYLCAVFKKEMNQTLNSFLTGVRVSKARVDLLQNPQKRIRDVAEDAGFRSASYFCKVFRQYESVSPDQYRKQRNADRARGTTTLEHGIA